MNRLSDLSSVMRTLRHGVEVGHWTLEALDTPSAGFRNNTAVDRKTFPGGYEGVQHRNLLRDQPIPPTQTPEAPVAAPEPITEPNCPF